MNEQDYEQLTLFPADSHVNRSVWLESRKDGRINATFGLKCSELSGNLRRVGLSVRTYLESCELPRGTWSRIWSAKVITSRCLILKLRLSERRTEGSASRLSATWWKNIVNKQGEPKMWKTPVASDAGNREFYRNSRGEPNLSGMVKMWPTVRSNETGTYQYSQGRHDRPTLTLTGAVKLLPTPTASEGRHGGQNSKYGRGDLHLTGAAMIWPTPRASDSKGCGTKGSKSAEHQLERGQLNGTVLYTVERLDPGLDEGVQSIPSTNGQLNPTWVEWLMGFPLGWTELNASETR